MEREGLLGREAGSWAALEAAVAKVPADRLTQPGVVPDWSVQDLVWHCAWWARYSGENLEKIAAGTYGDEEHDDAYWDTINARIAEESRGMSWADVLSGAAAARERVRAALVALPEVTIEAEKDFSGETFEHYEEHAIEIEKFASR